jgi:hypothetical protein
MTDIFDHSSKFLDCRGAIALAVPFQENPHLGNDC